MVCTDSKLRPNLNNFFAIVGSTSSKLAILAMTLKFIGLSIWNKKEDF